jgi:hypothetical protein
MRLAAALVVASLALVAQGCGGGDDIPPLPEGKFMATSQSITPKVALFAEPVDVQIDVLVDTDRYDPDRLDVTGSFKPYERDGDVVRTRRDQGRYSHLRFEYTIRCLVYECLPEVGGGPPEVQPGGLPPPLGSLGGGFGERKSVTLATARLTYDDPKKGVQAVRNLSWPPIQVVSRLNHADTNVTGIGFPFEATVAPLPAASYRVSPNVLGAALLAGALALLLLPAALIVRTVRRKPEIVEDPEPELSPLEKALRLVEWARAEGGPEERREALEALAYELDEPQPEHAREARRVAWTPPEPDPEAMGRLVEVVRAEPEPEPDPEPDATAA